MYVFIVVCPSSHPRNPGRRASKPLLVSECPAKSEQNKQYDLQAKRSDAEGSRDSTLGL
jgi:hypothetical protein